MSYEEHASTTTLASYPWYTKNDTSFVSLVYEEHASVVFLVYEEHASVSPCVVAVCFSVLQYDAQGLIHVCDMAHSHMRHDSNASCHTYKGAHTLRLCFIRRNWTKLYAYRVAKTHRMQLDAGHFLQKSH